MNKVLLGAAALALSATALLHTSHAQEACEGCQSGHAGHAASLVARRGGHPFHDVKCYSCPRAHQAAQRWAYEQSLSLPWHNGYYHAAYGEPYALVVPPTAEFQSNYGWGVGGTRVSPIYHQFARPYPGDGSATPGSGFLPTPAWPSDTTQFGVYYIRGPW